MLVSGGGSLCKTERSWAVAVPDGKESCSSMIWKWWVIADVHAAYLGDDTHNLLPYWRRQEDAINMSHIGMAITRCTNPK